MEKIKYPVLLIINTIIVTAIYYLLIDTLHFFPAMAIYQILAIIAICGYLFLVFKGRNEMGKAAAENRELPPEVLQKKRKELKIYIVFAFPFLFTVLIDYIYLLIFVDNPVIETITSSLK